MNMTQDSRPASCIFYFLLTIDSKTECVERCLCSAAGYLIKSRVCGSGVCDAQRSSLIQLQSVSESPISTVIMKLALIVPFVDHSYENLSKSPHYQTMSLYFSKISV